MMGRCVNRHTSVLSFPPFRVLFLFFVLSCFVFNCKVSYMCLIISHVEII